MKTEKLFPFSRGRKTSGYPRRNGDWILPPLELSISMTRGVRQVYGMTLRIGGWQKWRELKMSLELCPERATAPNGEWEEPELFESLKSRWEAA